MNIARTLMARKRMLLSGLTLLLVLAGLAATRQTAFAGHTGPCPIAFNRCDRHGYFSDSQYTPGTADTVMSSGNSVDPNSDAGMPVYNVNDFVGRMHGMLFNGGGSDAERQDRIGAAFIVNTMLGRWGSDFGGQRGVGVDRARESFGDWENRVRYYDSRGWVQWDVTKSFGGNYINSAYGDTDDGFTDDFFYMRGPEDIRAIIFNNPNGSQYTIKKNCGNPVGDLQGLEIPPPPPTVPPVPTTPPPPPPPPPPGSPSATPICDGTTPRVRVDWDPGGPQGSDGYNVDIDNDNNWGNGGWVQYSRSGTTSATLPPVEPWGGTSGGLSLVAGQRYQVRIYYLASKNHSAAPDPTFEAPNCARPNPPRVTPICDGINPAVRVEWPDGGPVQNAGGYNVDITDKPDFSRGGWFTPVGPTQTSLTFSSVTSSWGSERGSLTLSQGPTYRVRIYYRATGNHSAEPDPKFSVFNCKYDFRVTPEAFTPTLLPDNESPTGADFKTRFRIAYTPPPPANGPGVKLTTMRQYFIQRPTGPTTFTEINIVPAPTPSPHNNGGAPFTHPPGGSYDYPPAPGVDPRSLPPVFTGDQICARITVNPSAGVVDTNGNVVSVTTGQTESRRCEPILDKPYFRVYGGDVLTGLPLFDTACGTPYTSGSRILGYNKGDGAGAAGQLAAQAMGNIDGFSSATGRTGVPQPKKGLTFANDGPGAAATAYGGGFGAARCNRDYHGTISSVGPVDRLGPAPVFNLQSGMGSGYSSKTGGTGQLRIKSAPISLGLNEKRIVYVEGDAYVEDNIRFTDVGWNSNNIPQFYLIVKGNIFINANVERLDGVYIAQPDGLRGGNIYTCANGFALPDFTTPGSFYNQCRAKSLTVNGAFIAKSVKLLRTAWSLRDSSNIQPSGDPRIAETFNFSPEAFIGGPLTRSITGSATDYDSITSLPPVL